MIGIAVSILLGYGTLVILAHQLRDGEMETKPICYTGNDDFLAKKQR
ncbi:hypothetical protein KFU94_62915 [Chloroflexi bacterium TSY]|nr:hypothetical protein [Chloroflexi bacterium TSY]